MRRAPRLIALVLIAVAVVGCGGTSDHALNATLAALNVPATPPPRPSSTPTVACRNRTASLRPPATMPTPGAMPRGSFMARIKARGMLIAGVDQNTKLLSYYNPLLNRMQGFEIDLLHVLSQAIFGKPNQILFRAVTTDQRIPAVRDDSVDLVVDAMTITCARRKLVDFSTVYYDAGQRMLVPVNSHLRSIKELNGKRVCAAVGTTSIQTIRQFAPHAQAVLVPQRIDCLVKLQEGLVDAISTDDAILFGFNAQDPYTKPVGPRIADEPYGMAIKQTHPEFVRFVNGVLAQMRADGAWKRIYSLWFGPYAPAAAPPTARYAG